MDMNMPAALPTAALHRQLIEKYAPHWLRTAPPALHAKLRQAADPAMLTSWLEAARQRQPEVTRQLERQVAEHQAHQARIAPHLERLGTLQAFAEPRLVDGIKARFGLQLNVQATYLLHANHAQTDTSFLGVNKDPIMEANRALRDATRPLLDAALQNFTLDETVPGAMDNGPSLKAEVFDSYQILGPLIRGTALPIAAHEFAALARELDLGGQYQAHIDAIFSADAAEQFQAFDRSAMLVELHIARLQERLDADTYQSLVAWVAGQQGTTSKGLPRVCSVLRLWDVELPGILVFSRDRDHSDTVEPIVVYIPDDPVAPLQAYPSSLAFHHALRERLFSKGYLDFFSRFFPARHRSRLIDRLYSRLYPTVIRGEGAGHQWLDTFADRQARLHLGESRLTGPLFEALYRRKLAAIKDNARFHGVPTAEQDQRSRDERLAWWRDLALNTLNVAAFAVPLLGELMLTVTAAQLGYEVFEGIESWSRGEQGQALSYLVDVLENMALIGAMGHAGASATGLPAVEVPEFIENLRPVQLPDGRTRLWKPDLAPFAHDLVLPAGLEPDANGLIPYQGKRWLILDGQPYAVKPSADGQPHVLEHPRKPGGYEPSLRHNGERAWLHELDQPEQMQGLTLLRRLGYAASEYPEVMARQILRCCDLPESVLRQALVSLHRPPALLADTALRFRLAGEAGGQHEVFQQRYQQLQHSSEPLYQALQEHLPIPLPKAVGEEILAWASEPERASLGRGQGLSPRLSEEARLYAQQVRLTRAYEGLYLQLLSSADSDRLVLHSLSGLPGWSADVRLEVRRGHFRGPLLDSIGAEDAPIRKVLVSSQGGYEPYDAEGLHLDGRDNLFAAVMHALPDAQRQALGLPHVGQGADLQALVRQHPLTRRQARLALGLQAVRPGFRSPMRLADGRIGYPLSGRGAGDWGFTRESLLDKLRLLEFEDLYPEQLYEQLSAQGLSHAQMDTRLNQLLDEQITLRARLNAWAERSAAIPGLAEDAPRLESRTRIAEAIWRHWRLHSLPELARGAAPLELTHFALEDYPADLPAFFNERVTRLVIDNATPYAGSPPGLGHATDSDVLADFLSRFPRSEALTIHQPASANPLFSRFPDLAGLVARQLPNLTELRLSNQGLLLDQACMDSLLSLPRLRNLDLSGNRFSPLQPLDLSRLQLERLVLERTALDRWPAWLSNLLPDQVGELSLAHNRLSSLPEAILNNPPSLSRHSRIDLRGNPLSEASLMHASLGEQRAQASFSFLLDIPPGVQAQLDSLLAERKLLVEAIEGWVGASTSSAPLTAQRIADRQTIGEALLQHWHAAVLGNDLEPLELTAIDLGEFPRRVPTFMARRIRGLRLQQVTTTSAQLDEVLRRLPRLSLLQVEGRLTGLRELPGALAQLPELNTLSLINQELTLDQPAVEFLARLPALEMLELDGNRLGQIDDVSALHGSALRWLSLRNTGLRDWPRWLEDLLPNQLEALILDNNQLTSIPESLLANPRSEHHHCDINLLRNPLPHEVMLRAHVSEAYNRAYSFLMDLPEDIRRISWREPHDSDTEGSDSDSDASGHRHGGAAPDQDSLGFTPWQGEDSALASRRQSVWASLQAQPDGGSLLELVDQLRHTADYRKPGSRTALIDRVWRVLEAAEQDPTLRGVLNATAQEPLTLLTNDDTCPDGLILEFNQMEVMVFTRQALRDAHGEGRGPRLLELVRRLYRLQALDGVARRQAAGRDEAEVRLAYRLHWAKALDLPVPPGNMLYQAHAEIRPGELEAALAEVRTGEQGDAFLDYAADQDFWTGWLRERYAERFQRLEQDYRDSLTALTERFESLNDPAFESAARQLQRQYEDDQRALLKALTNREGLAPP